MSPATDGRKARTRMAGQLLSALILGVTLLASCGRDRDEAPTIDATPPAKVTDLAARALSDSIILVTWTAPGDNGNDGTADRYDFRYSTEPFPAQGHFPATYPAVPNTPDPAPAGSAESLLVGGLLHRTTYHFGMRVLDEEENLSPVSNIASATTSDTLVVIPPDLTPPAMIADLQAQRLDLAFFRFTWTATGDDGLEGQATSYEMRWSRDPLTETNWPMATPVEGVPAPAISGKRQTLEVTFPTGLEDLYVSLRAVDNEANRSTLATSVLLPGLTPRTWYVSADGQGDTPTIQAALDMAGPGDTVLVGPGEYRVNLRFPAWGVALKSNAGNTQTLLRPLDSSLSIITVEGEREAIWIVDGFTMSGGRVQKGGAIRGRSGRPTVINNVFEDNRADWGGAVHISTDNVGAGRAIRLEGNLFQENEASGGGGAVFLGSFGEVTLVIKRNVFRRNRASFDGGGVFAGWSHFGSVQVVENVLAENSAGDHGGGLFLASLGVAVDVRQNLFFRNVAFGVDIGDSGAGGGLLVSQSSGMIASNTFVENSGRTESGDGGGAITLRHMRPATVAEDLRVESNIMTSNVGGVIAVAYSSGRVQLGVNLTWLNSGPGLVKIQSVVPATWGSGFLEADPQFCDPERNDFRVSQTSPAIRGEGVMGAYTEVGCAPTSPNH